MCLSLEHQNPSKPLKKWVILIALRFRYTFYRPQTKGLRARKIGLQYQIRKGRKQIWGRFSNPWNSNGIEWNRLILPTWSRILMYLPNSVGNRHKKAFKFIFECCGSHRTKSRGTSFLPCPFFYSALRASVALRATVFGHPSGDVPCASEDMACGYKVHLGQIRSEEIVYRRFIKIPLG